MRTGLGELLMLTTGALEHLLLSTSSLWYERGPSPELLLAAGKSSPRWPGVCSWVPVLRGRLVSPLMTVSGLGGRESLGDSWGSPVDCWVPVGEEREGQPLNLIPGAWGGDTWEVTRVLCFHGCMPVTW